MRKHLSHKVENYRKLLHFNPSKLLYVFVTVDITTIILFYQGKHYFTHKQQLVSHDKLNSLQPPPHLLTISISVHLYVCHSYLHLQFVLRNPRKQLCMVKELRARLIFMSLIKLNVTRKINVNCGVCCTLFTHALWQVSCYNFLRNQAAKQNHPHFK